MNKIFVADKSLKKKIICIHTIKCDSLYVLNKQISGKSEINRMCVKKYLPRLKNTV
jgi:hypothetical protein